MSKIPYCDETLNCVVGCTPCSPACEHCWSKDLHDKRHEAYLAGKKLPKQYAKPFSEIQLLPERLEQLKHWRKPKTIFVCSGSDLFHEDVSEDFIDKIMAATIAKRSRQHTYLFLTKRIDIAKKYFETLKGFGVMRLLQMADVSSAHFGDNIIPGIPVWNQKSADRDIPILLDCWKGKIWLSIEPPLEPICLDNFINASESLVDQIIVGCESGTNRRYCPENWIRNIVTQCDMAKTPVYVKQIQYVDGKVITDPKLFPKDLQRRELIWRTDETS